jgi:hypothetical protein
LCTPSEAQCLTSIQAVLNELLECVDWALYNFARGDAIHHCLLKPVYARRLFHVLTGALRKAARPCVAVRLSNASPHFSEIFTGARFLGPRKALKQLQAAADCTTHSSRQACRQVITVAQWCTAYARMVPQLCSPLATKSSLVPVPTVMMMMMKALWVRAPFGAPRAYLVTACFSQLGLFRQWRVSILLPALAGLSGSYIMCTQAAAVRGDPRPAHVRPAVYVLMDLFPC